jgi:hypothetical protein
MRLFVGKKKEMIALADNHNVSYRVLEKTDGQTEVKNIKKNSKRIPIMV